MNKRSEIIKKLKAITGKAGFLRILADIAREDTFSKVKDFELEYSPDMTLYSELGYLAGLMVSQSYEPEKYIEEIDNESFEKQEEEIRKLLKDLHLTYVSFPTNAEDLVSSDSIIESTFYAESGAYDLQFLDHISKLYRHDIDWINSKIGFDIEQAIYIFKAILFRMETAYNYALNEKDVIKELDMSNRNNSFNLFCVSPAEIYAYSKMIGAKLEPEDVMRFLTEFSYCGQGQYENFDGIETQNIITEYPIIIIDDSRYFISSTILLSKAIYSRPYYIGIKDNEYSDTFSKNIGNALEETAEEYLRKSFGKENTYRGVKVESKKGEAISDADVLCICDDAVVIAQCKNKRLTAPSKKGDISSAKKDFLKAIQDPYEQGCKIATAISSKLELRFILDNGKHINLNKDITKVFILCITSDYYPGSKFQEILFSEQNNSFTLTQMSIFDLELTMKYLVDPYDFLYYLYRRSLMRHKIVSENEINILGYYLEADLAFPEKSDINLIDNDFEWNFRKDVVNKHLTGEESNYFIDNRRLPRDYIELVQKIELIKCDFSKVDISFFLRKISSDTAREIMKYLNSPKAKNSIFDFSMTLKEDKRYAGGLTFVTGTDLNRITKAVIVLGDKHFRACPDGDWLSIGIISGKIVGIFFFKSES